MKAPLGDSRLTAAGDSASPRESASDEERSIRLASEVTADDEGTENDAWPADAEVAPRPLVPAQPIALEQVVDSVYQSFPLLRIAILERGVAFGENLAAQGEFDLKLKADSISQPQGFYRNYRNSIRLEQPTWFGGNVFGGYRIGRGEFEPWYGNRETNDGGELLMGFSVPLWRNRTIDERRARFWRTAYGQDLVEPAIRAQLLEFVRDGSIAYWEWVAAGRQFQLAEQLLKLAQDREGQLETAVREGSRPESDLTDNRRLIVGRRVKLIDTQRKLQTTAAKLSLFLRLPGGMPFVPGPEHLPAGFPEPFPVAVDMLEQDILYAQSRRPELVAYDIQRQQLEVDLQQAINELQPELEGSVIQSKDVGGPSSSKKDKTPYQFEGGLYFEVPLQRRKARGKIASIEGKIAQLLAKRQFQSDKIAVEVQAAVISLDTAYRSIGQAREAITLNEEMERFENIRLDQGASDFLRLNLRETATFDARVVEVEALLRYFEAQSEYRAAIAADLPEVIE
jgi:hypothetical protein